MMELIFLFAWMLMMIMKISSRISGSKHLNCLKVIILNSDVWNKANFVFHYTQRFALKLWEQFYLKFYCSKMKILSFNLVSIFSLIFWNVWFMLIKQFLRFFPLNDQKDTNTLLIMPIFQKNSWIIQTEPTFW